jgi:excisionase family DNA binding protein
MKALHFDELPDVLTADEVAEVLRLGRNTVYDSLRTGVIPSVRIGRRLLIPKAALLRLLEERKKAE